MSGDFWSGRECAWAVALIDALTGQRRVAKVMAYDETHARGIADLLYPHMHVDSCKRWPE